MKNIIKLSALVIALLIITQSCKKYPEGPAFTLRSAKNRLTGDWTVEQAMYNSDDITALMATNTGTFKIKKDETYSTSGAQSDEGTWKLGGDKDDVRFTSNQAGAIETSYKILKLKNKEMWLKHTETNGDVLEIHFKQ